MNEEMNNAEAVEKQEQVEEKSVGEKSEKTYTQEEYERGVAKTGAKYLRKIEKYKEELEKSRSSEKVKKYMAERIGFKGSDEEFMKVLAEHFDDNVNEVLNDFNNGDLSKREADIKLETYEFLNDDETTDEDIVEEFERISGKPKSKQTNADRMKLDLMSKRYYKIVSKGYVKTAEKWYKANVGGDFDKFIGKEDFREFVKDLNIPLNEAVKKYCTLKGMKKTDETKENAPKVSSGSAKDTNGDNVLGYFTQEQVSKMSLEEIRKNYDAIVKSEKYWKK